MVILSPRAHHREGARTEFETIVAKTEGALGHLVLNRPDRLIAIGAIMLCEIGRALRWFEEQPEVRVVFVRRELGQLGLRMADVLESMHGEAGSPAFADGGALPANAFHAASREATRTFGKRR